MQEGSSIIHIITLRRYLRDIEDKTLDVTGMIYKTQKAKVIVAEDNGLITYKWDCYFLNLGRRD